MIEGCRRCPSAITCCTAHVTPEASHTLPENWTHWAAVANDSAPSITTPGPEARITNGLPAAPEAVTDTCSR